jgi:hypothetical protein
MKMKPVTHRDRYIIAKELAYAIAAIDSIPEDRMIDVSDRDDMVAILCALCSDPSERERFARGVEIATGVLPDLTDWKAGPILPDWDPIVKRGKRRGP